MASAEPLNPSTDPEADGDVEVTIAANDGNIITRFVRNSPWVAISILVHVLIISLLTVVYFGGEKVKEQVNATAVRLAPSTMDTAPQIEPPPEIIDRNAVPVLPDQEEGPVNPDENYIPDAAPGRQGEITDEVDPNKEAGIYNPDPEALSNLPSGATGGTPIGVGKAGHTGTGTSAFSSRRAGGGGRGGGGLGQGGKGGRGGSKTDAAVMAALQWLKNHQSPDGRWDGANFSEQCKKNRCDGAGNSINDVGLTGLALLCFLGAGETHQTGSCRNTVKNGLKYLMSVQDEDDGCFGAKAGQHFMYNHACAALAMAEAYGMTRSEPFHVPAQKGIDFAQRAQNPYRAWRYAYPPDGDNDCSVTGWMVMVLKSGKIAGLEVDEGAIKNAVSFIEEMTDPSSGRTGYHERGTGPARIAEMQDKFPAAQSESMTAVGVLCRIFDGHTAASDPMINKGADLMVRLPPKWDEASGDIDFYYWYYATLAMFQVGGSRWDRWNESMKTAIIDHQRTDASQDEFGSWDSLDPWKSEGGRVYSTALNCLCMEVYYRYDRVFGISDKPKSDPNAKK